MRTTFLHKVQAKLSAVLYHKTGESNAIQILKEDKFRLSTWLGGSADRPKDKDHLWYLSTSYKPGAYRKDSSGVVFVLNGEKLDRDYSGEPFDYWGPEWRAKAKEAGRDGAYDEAEERIFSDEPNIPASHYIHEIHADWFISNNGYGAHAYKRHRELTKLAKQHGISLYWYENEKDLDTLPKDKAKKFSDFPAGPRMTPEDLQNERHRGNSPYSVKRWTSLLSIEPAKSFKDIPKDIRKYLSTYSDGHTGFESDIHNASKNMKTDELRYVYKLQGQMKRAGTKTVKEFYWKMMDKLWKLQSEHEKVKTAASFLVKAQKFVSMDPKIAAEAKTPYDKLCLEIATDTELWEHIVHYVQGDPEALNEYPELTKKLEGILRKIQPFKPHMTSNLYRGESKNRKFDHPREVESWTPNKDVALDFAKNVADPAVRSIPKPLLIQGVLVADVGYWRSLIDPTHKHYGDAQSEWLVLRPKEVDTVYTEDTGWVE